MKRIVIIFCIIVALFLTFIISTKIIESSENIIVKNTFNDKILEQYNNNLEVIEKDLDYITYGKPEDSVRWYKFKNEDIDKEYLDIINALIKDIRIFYAFSTSNGEIYYTNANYILKFKGIDKINKKDFDNKIEGYNINNNQYLALFNKYSDLFLGKDSYNFINLKMLLDPMITFSETINNVEVHNYKELLTNEYNKSLFLKNITEYLRNYYDYLNKKN